MTNTVSKFRYAGGEDGCPYANGARWRNRAGSVKLGSGCRQDSAEFWLSAAAETGKQ